MKVVFDRKFALNSPTSVLNKKKERKKRRKIELIRLRWRSFMIKRDSFVRFMCKVSFCILFIWVCLIICITLDLVLHQYMFRLHVFKLSSRFFQLCLDSLHVFYRFAGFRFCQRKKFSSLDVVIVILISLCNSALSHYVSK